MQVLTAGRLTFRVACIASMVAVTGRAACATSAQDRAPIVAQEITMANRLVVVFIVFSTPKSAASFRWSTRCAHKVRMGA
jgi:hypothetical protein